MLAQAVLGGCGVRVPGDGDVALRDTIHRHSGGGLGLDWMVLVVLFNCNHSMVL